jgi:hypothetical protein
MTTQNTKVKLNKNIENLGKKNLNRNPGNKSPFFLTKCKAMPADLNKWKT